MELETRQIVHTGATKFPTDEWTAQQRWEATPWGSGPKYLVRDRDSKYAAHFSAVAVSSSIKELKTPYRTPHANGICERFMGSLRRESLDHILFQDGRHVQRVVRGYIAYFNQERPHQVLGQPIPDRYDLPGSKATSGRIRSRVILGDLLELTEIILYQNLRNKGEWYLLTTEKSDQVVFDGLRMAHFSENDLSETS